MQLKVICHLCPDSNITCYPYMLSPSSENLLVLIWDFVFGKGSFLTASNYYQFLKNRIGELFYNVKYLS